MIGNAGIDITYHYPPELMKLLIDTIPLLNRGKQDIFLFFRGAGVSESIMDVPFRRWKADRQSINKYDITRSILTALNERKEACLRERREVLKRIVEFDNFSVCWDTDRLKAKGLVAEIREVVNVKDSFTRMNLEREHERAKRVEKEHKERAAILQKQNQLTEIKKDLYRLFPMNDRQKRGKALEGILNRLFQVHDLSIREAFALVGDSGEGVIEQIDGVVEIDGHMYFVEMKWWDSPLGVPEVSQHLVRVYQRAEGRAIIISASDFTAPAISTCKGALQQKVVILCTLQEIVTLLESEGSLKEFLKKKVNAAIIDKNPLCR